METEHESPDIVSHAFCMATAVERFMEQARMFYYAVMLSGHACPKCGGNLEMIQEGECRCCSCGHTLDPTLMFQQCELCGGKPKRTIRRYQCSQCGHDMASRFRFDGMVFDAEYFRQKMAESRAHKQELRERVRQMLAESRSAALPPQPMDLNSMPGLLDALNQLVQTGGSSAELALPPTFSLGRYQAHVEAHIRPIAISLEQIPPMSENTRLDRIWRFTAIIFLAHAGILDVWQDGPTIMVKQRETDTEGQGVPGSIEEADGIA